MDNFEQIAYVVLVSLFFRLPLGDVLVFLLLIFNMLLHKGKRLWMIVHLPDIRPYREN